MREQEDFLGTHANIIVAKSAVSSFKAGGFKISFDIIPSSKYEDSFISCSVSKGRKQELVSGG